MRVLEAWVLAYLLNALWQVPLVAAAAWLMARGSRGLGPRFAHRVWVTALVLEVVLPALSMLPGDMLPSLAMYRMLLLGRHPAQAAQVTVVMGAGQAQGRHSLAPALLGALVLVYVGSVAWFAVRLGYGLYRTAALRRRAGAVTLTGAAHSSFLRYARIFGVESAAVAASAEISGPATIGIRRRTLLLPTEMQAALLPEDMDAALAHEFAHMQRKDFAKNVAYELLSLPAAFHPLLWLTRRRIAETRELVCDAMAAAAVLGQQRYARSLVRLASRFSERAHAANFHAIGIFDANHFGNFERRVMQLTEMRREWKGMRRTVTVAAGLLLGAGACSSALALRMQVAAPAPTPAPQSVAQPAQVLVAVPRPATGQPAQSFKIDVQPVAVAAASPSPDSAPMRIKVLSSPVAEANQTAAAGDARQVSAGAMAGNILTKVNPVYPPDAKAAGVQGAVVLHAVIGKDGVIQNLQVVSGPEELQASAIDAVRQWTYKPYLLNGNPTEVETTITVNYSLQP